jgi:AcrR family transcriptional regulator
MVIRQRAIQAEDKEERRNAILDAAQRLFIDFPDRLANVSEVADAAGLAKGTVYLYFPSKEELLLALHERSSDVFFRALIERLERPDPVTIEEVFAITRDHLVRSPTYLPLAGMCFGMMEKNISAEATNAFHERMAGRLARAGAGVEDKFPVLAPGRGVMLLVQSYGLIIGLWQLSQKNHQSAGELHCPSHDVFRWEYETEIERALYALWAGSVQQQANASAARLQGEARPARRKVTRGAASAAPAKSSKPATSSSRSKRP